MKTTYTTTGTLTDERTLTLDEPLPLPSVNVRVTVKPLETPSQRSYAEIMSGIYRRQQARGHRPPTKTEVDAYLRYERSSWDK